MFAGFTNTNGVSGLFDLNNYKVLPIVILL